MQSNNLTGTNLRISILSLGTMMFGSQTDEKDSLRIMDYAYEQGINLFDTAAIGRMTTSRQSTNCLPLPRNKALTSCTL